MKVMIINGPNLNLLGIREKNIYGSTSYKTLRKGIRKYAKKKKVRVRIYQSNEEGKLVDLIQKAYFKRFDGIIINPAAYTHTSIALLDALKSVCVRTIEVHISDIEKREDFRKKSYVGEYAEKRIIGHGVEGYYEAIDALLGEKKL